MRVVYTTDTVGGSSGLPFRESLNMIGMRSNAHSADSTRNWTFPSHLMSLLSEEMERVWWYTGRPGTLI